jgi:hypothetical protein
MPTRIGLASALMMAMALGRAQWGRVEVMRSSIQLIPATA